MGPVILCADDFGLAPGIDRAILKLAETGRISAVSCMTGGASWRQNAPELGRMSDRLDVGLHMTFTEIPPLGPMPKLAATGTLPQIGEILRRALLRQLDCAEIRAEARRQIDTFCQYFGRPPDHIDGHQHVHCFPVIRAVTYELATEYGCYVRACTTPLTAIINGQTSKAKAAVINSMGCGFDAGLEAKKIPHNRRFFGLHDFNPAHDIRAMYAGWLQPASDHALINCHPGEGMVPGDALAAWRMHEYDFLRSAGYTALLQETGTIITRFKPPVTPAD